MTDKKIDDFLKAFKEENDFIAKINDSGMNSIEHTKYHAMIKLLVFEIKAVQYFDGHLRLTDIGIEIHKKGGWIEYNKNKEEKERIEFDKSKADLILVKKTLKEFPKTKLFALIGAVISVILGLKELIEWIMTLS